ncbi:acyltransferase [Pantoea sp.]|uniref:acyltransferase family protein n=1 Tax=Pantoea sp. TaxID=69393 RepID=UPI002600D24C|nr:acyltransferase [Pantoea sp.]
MSQASPELNGAGIAQTYPTSISSSRVIFAGQLRAIAFLCVVIVHWLGIYSLDHEFISKVTGASGNNIGNPSYYLSLVPPLPYFNYGPFGVSVFFLISGFVISYSLRKKSRSGYLKSRALRIYPTYIACSVIMMAVYASSHAYWGSEAQIGLSRFILNISLLGSLFNYESIDYVNWTLSIEIKFYLCCAIIYSALKNAALIKVIAMPFLFMAVTVITSHFQIGSSEQGHFSFDALKIELIYVSYMILGVLINFFYEKKITSGKFIASTIIVSLCIAASWRIGPQANQFIGTGVNYIYGYIFFFVAFLLNKHIKENRVISFLSEISYSFYALHSVIGYCIIRWMESMGFHYLYSLTVAFTSVLVISYIMYITIEKKSIKLSKKIN